MSAPESTLSILRVLNGSGDTHLTWDRERVAAGDDEAQAAVREAERIFEKARASGAQAFRILPNGDSQRMDRFDPEAREVLVVPPMVGG